MREGRPGAEDPGDFKVHLHKQFSEMLPWQGQYLMSEGLQLFRNAFTKTSIGKLIFACET